MKKGKNRTIWTVQDRIPRLTPSCGDKSYFGCVTFQTLDNHLWNSAPQPLYSQCGAKIIISLFLCWSLSSILKYWIRHYKGSVIKSIGVVLGFDFDALCLDPTGLTYCGRDNISSKNIKATRAVMMVTWRTGYTVLCGRLRPRWDSPFV